MNNFCVITTINPPTKAVEVLYEKFGENLIVVGDRKTPYNWNYKNAHYMPSDFGMAHAPNDHYARKNMGYLEAIVRGADLIYDTDDDNIPNDNWKIRGLKTSITQTSKEKWCNVYEPVTSGLIWPRGFPLNKVKDKPQLEDIEGEVESSIQQGLADDSPDVDAIWRLTNNRIVKFWIPKRIWLKNTWCPFNSQSTWWFKEAFPLMYLPVHCSFRMTDIWRSFIAQRCLWEIGQGVTFHSPSEVYQDRNEHDLMKDFEQEIPGYLNNEKIVEKLSRLALNKGKENICQNLSDCYVWLVQNEIFPKEELDSVNAWIKDYENITANLG